MLQISPDCQQVCYRLGDPPAGESRPASGEKEKQAAAQTSSKYALAWPARSRLAPRAFRRNCPPGHLRFRRIGGLVLLYQNLLSGSAGPRLLSLILLRFLKLVRFDKMAVGALFVPAAVRIAVDAARLYGGLL
jgi:hypothetical protein